MHKTNAWWWNHAMNVKCSLNMKMGAKNSLHFLISSRFSINPQSYFVAKKRESVRCVSTGILFLSGIRANAESRSVSWFSWRFDIAIGISFCWLTRVRYVFFFCRSRCSMHPKQQTYPSQYWADDENKDNGMIHQMTKKSHEHTNTRYGPNIMPTQL